jgi:hypothetical protein
MKKKKKKKKKKRKRNKMGTKPRHVAEHISFLPF